MLLTAASQAFVAPVEIPLAASTVTSSNGNNNREPLLPQRALRIRMVARNSLAHNSLAHRPLRAAAVKQAVDKVAVNAVAAVRRRPEMPQQVPLQLQKKMIRTSSLQVWSEVVAAV
jgi:hypothetical protein